jgi:DNA-binding response OmpR family regulator
MRGTAVVQEASNAIGIHSPGRNHRSMIRSGDLIADLERRIVTADGKPIRLTGKEYSILTGRGKSRPCGQDTQDVWSVGTRRALYVVPKKLTWDFFRSLLELLSLRLDVTVTKEMLLGHLYGGKDKPELKIIDVFVCNLRKKLARATDGKDYIETVWGRGYRLCAPAEMPALPHP